MAVQPSYVLCFTGRMALLGAANFWLFHVFDLSGKPAMIFLSLVMVISHSSTHARMQRDLWKKRHKTPAGTRENTSAWLPSLGMGLAILIGSEIYLYFRPSTHTTFVLLGMALFPLAVLVDSYLNEIGIERPLCMWHEQQLNIPIVKQRLSPGVVASKTPSVQRIGRP